MYGLGWSRGWGPDSVIGSEVEGEVLWRLRASLVNKDPGLAERLRCEETVEGVRAG